MLIRRDILIDFISKPPEANFPKGFLIYEIDRERLNAVRNRQITRIKLRALVCRESQKMFDNR